VAGDSPPDAATSPSEPKSSKWTSFLIASGFFATLFGVGGTIAENWLKSDREAICSEAHAAMLDDRLNPDVPKALRERYLKKQAEIAIRCAELGDDL
jgi:hypothetical protein